MMSLTVAAVSWGPGPPTPSSSASQSQLVSTASSDNIGSLPRLIVSPAHSKPYICWLLQLLLLLPTPAAKHAHCSPVVPAASPACMNADSACMAALWQVHSHGCVQRRDGPSWLHLRT